ncbi:MAG TPA: sialidase family protein, partial [Actinomycetota bacterium]|nr:sialidase family protein [Actinomycetota bacterium]
IVFVVFRLVEPVGGPAPTGTPPVASPGSASSGSPRNRPSATRSPAAGPRVAPVTFDSVSFIDARDGWAAGGAGRSAPELLVSRTSDGGRTWSAGVAVAPRPPDPSQVAVRFASLTQGWVSALGLFSTTDGGATWHSAGQAGWVGPVVVTGATAWALQYPCGPGEQCTPRLLTSPLGSVTWVPAARQPALPAGPATLVSAGGSVAFIAGSSTGGAVLLKTTDGGATWAVPPNPCPASLTGATLATLDGTRVWVACTGRSQDEAQDKALYVSADGGDSWKLAASTGGNGPPAVGSLGSAGAVLGLTLSGPSSGFLVLAGYGVVRSTDGGVSWNATSVSAKAIPTGNNVLMATFSGASDGWAATCCGGGVPYGSPGLYGTTDGGATWSAVAVSP